MLDSVMFERNNARIPGKPRTKFDWLNTDEAEVDKYIDDPHCGFLFTAAGYLDLLRIMQRATRAQWYTNLPPLFPMLLIAGEDDPVGQYGKGIKTTYKKMRDLGKHKTAMSLFPGMRHEILLHPDCEKVFETVISWFDKVLAQR
jgi:alpha-beta hydrolase superfamily lysophospholipase